MGEDALNKIEEIEGVPTYPEPEQKSSLDDAKGVFLNKEDFKKIYLFASKLEYEQAIKIMPFLENAKLVKSVTDEVKEG